MKPPNFRRPFVLHTDACGTALGSCLMQRYDDGLHPIAYHSRTFSLAERGYDVRHKENLAIVDSFRTWRHLLLGSRTLVHTDHHSLIYLFTCPHLKERQARWLEELSSFDFDIVYKKGVHQRVADPLSRLPVLSPLLFAVCSTASPPSSSFVGEVTAAYHSDPLFSRLSQHRHYRKDGDLLYFIREPVPRIYVPPTAKTLIRKILTEHHDSTSSGHLG
eukprot:Nk52_evm1s984 gene=Nk52_evmTU1s984